MNLFIYKTEMLEGEDYNFFLRDENLNTDSDSISFFKDNASTYMGVKTIQEGTLADTNNNPIKKKKSPKKNRNKKKGKKTKKKKSSSGSLFSSLSESSSESYIEKLNENDIKEISNIQTNQDDKNIKINKKNSEKNIKEISTEFYWDEGGNTIYITGSFCDWKEFFLMEEKSKGVFKKTIMLLPGFYQYKFKVDNNWAYSKKQPKFEDNNGNVNNFIDTTQINLETNKNEVEVEIKETTLKEKNKKDNINIKRKSSNSSLGLLNNIEYSTYIPLKGEFNIKPEEYQNGKK